MPQRILIFLQPVFHFNQTVDVRFHRLQPLIKRMQRFFVGRALRDSQRAVKRFLHARPEGVIQLPHDLLVPQAEIEGGQSQAVQLLLDVFDRGVVF